MKEKKIFAIKAKWEIISQLKEKIDNKGSVWIEREGRESGEK